ncbi:MAG: shikimate kinase [Candidatus Melainabacteria bacterium]|nr:shikimate kinase [Candidatus Melainabacteria bacterium]
MAEDKLTETSRPSQRSGLHKFACLIVTGLPGSGKTTCGKLLSKRLGYRFIDSDKLIERAEGMPVREIFLRYGEPHFRTLERDVLRLLESRLQSIQRDSEPEYIGTTGIEGSVAVEMLKAVQVQGLVLAVGGGMPEPEENRERLKRLGTVIYLFSEPSEIAARLKEDGARPLLSGQNTINDAKVYPQINHEKQTITDKKISAPKNSSKDVLKSNISGDSDCPPKPMPDNQPGGSPDNASIELLTRLEELLDRRRAAYESADITIDTGGLAPHQIVNRLQEALKRHQQIL